jgi:hypothetical protein
MAKAMVVYNVGKFVQWPDSVFENGNTPLRICVLGEKPIRSAFGELHGKKVQGRLVEIKELESERGADTCHMLFLENKATQQLGDVLRAVQDLSVLTVYGGESFTEMGCVVGVTKKGSKMELSVDLSAAKRTGLTISSRLLEVAHVVGATSTSTGHSTRN